MKNTILIISRFLHNNLLILFNEWLLLDVNPKTRFLDVHKISKAQKFKKKIFPNKIPERLNYKSIDFICYLEYLVIS